MTNETRIMLVTEIADYILRNYVAEGSHASNELFYIDEDDECGNTSYTELAQDLFNKIYDEIETIITINTTLGD